ncbi:MAG: phage antirepressor [Pseudomonadota bacterium]
MLDKIYSNYQFQIFAYDGDKIRAVIDDRGEPWFVANDISSLLGYRMTSDATRLLDKEEKGTQILPTAGGLQKFTIVSESGLYSLIFASRKPGARTFKKWVTSEVLPSIRKTGSYNKQADLNDPKQLRLLLLDYADKIAKDQPKVQFYDEFINSEGLYNLQNAARALNHSPTLFIRSLKDTYLFYQGSALVPYQRYREQGLFEVKSTIVDNKARYQTYVTPKGLEYFAKHDHVFINIVEDL